MLNLFISTSQARTRDLRSLNSYRKGRIMLKSDFNLAPAAGLHHHPSAASPFLGEQKPSTAAVTSKKLLGLGTGESRVL